MPNPTWADYVRALTAGEYGKDVAAKTGQSESAVSRWKNGTHVPEPRQVVAFARTYDRDPVEALIAAGYLDDDDAVRPADAAPRRLAIRDFTDLELAEEMVRRVAAGQHDLLEQPLDADHPAMRVLDED